MAQSTLFPLAAAPSFARGFVYEPGFLDEDEEAALVRAIRELPLAPAEYRQFHAKRRIVSYGGRYDFTRRTLDPAEPIPPFLHPLRRRVAAWAGRPAERFTHALVTEYAPGTQLGWNRDLPDFGLVAGVSLHGPARMRFRRYPPKPRERAIAVELAPRSIYRLGDEARWGWQHAIPPTPALRYSITFRTLRADARSARSG
jgi:alkylated DNA repair dioxygenase AlkB